MFKTVRPYVAYSKEIIKRKITPNIRIDNAYVKGGTVYVDYSHPAHCNTKFTSSIKNFCSTNREYEVFDKEILFKATFAQNLLGMTASRKKSFNKKLSKLISTAL